MPDRSLLIYIPSYNAASFLEQTVRRIPWSQLPLDTGYRILFVDNKSTDSTLDAIQRARHELAALGQSSDLIAHPRNLGYGGSVKSAIRYALDNGFDYLAVLHADGQYAPELLPDLIRNLLKEPRAALHFGSRLSGQPLRGGMPLYKFLANHLLSGLQNLCSGLRLTEYHSGYRLYRLEHLARIPWQRLSDGFVIDNEIIFMIHDAGFLITESPIPTFYGAEKSHVPRIGTPLAILRNLFEYVLSRAGLRSDPRYVFGGSRQS